MIRISSLLIAGTVAGAAFLAPAHGARAADGVALTTTEYSAQQRQQRQAAPRRAAAPRRTTTTRTVTPRGARTTRTVTRPGGSTATRTTTINRRGTTSTRTTVRAPGGGVRSQTTVRRVAPPARSVTFAGPRQTFAGTAARRWSTGGGTWAWRGQNYRYWRTGPWRVRYGNGWRTFVAVGLIAPIVVGAATYYPYAYVSAPADVCEGITEDGCQLTWSEVELEGGGTAPQCVTYCPWQN